MKTAIRVKNLVKKYSQVTALKGVSLEVREGTIYGLLYPNGAGKTTTINILQLFLNLLHVRKLIDIVPQRLCLDLRLTGYKNVYFHGRLKGVPSSILKKRIDELAEALDMKRHLKRRVREYSGGMIRKIQFMQALVTRPKVLLLDEPTLTLDPVSRRIVWDLFRRLVLEEKTTIFMAT
ncbi:MAG: ABC transporter ATP-binding protein, partial [Thermoprotei archaeon]